MTLGLFAPLPLPVMIPFMGYQSLVMGEAFGLSYQYAKRKISAMSNEEFNKLTIPEVQKMLKNDIQSAIPTMKASMDDMVTLQKDMINYAVAALAALPKQIFDAVVGVASGGQTVQQGEGGLPVGVAGFLRPVMTDPIGGILKQGRIVTPDPALGMGNVVNESNQQELFNMQSGPDTPPNWQQMYQETVTSPKYQAEQRQREINAQERLVQQRITDNKMREQEIQSQLTRAGKKNLPSDPRTILSQRDQLIKNINYLVVTIKAMLTNMKRYGPYGDEPHTLPEYQASLLREQQALNRLLQTWNF